MTSICHESFIEKRKKTRFHPQAMLVKSISFTGSLESPRITVKDFHDLGIGFVMLENHDVGSVINISIAYADEKLDFITCIVKNKARLGMSWRYGCVFHIRDQHQKDILQRMTSHAHNKEETFSI